MRKACLMYIDECFQFAVGAEFGEIGLRRTETLSALKRLEIVLLSCVMHFRHRYSHTKTVHCCMVMVHALMPWWGSLEVK